MSHGKETPRQKMIGMMYLVLMAMLALNVSNEVLNAFDVLDQGLRKTIHTLDQTNDKMLKDFDAQLQMNESKVGPWHTKAQKVKEDADAIVKLLQDKKIEILEYSGDTEAFNADSVIDATLIGAKDNVEAPANIMVGDNNDKAGKKIQGMIEEYREFLLSSIITPDGPEQIRSSIESGLVTETAGEHEEEVKKGTEKHEWAREHFEHLPLSGVLTIMTGLQINVRNAEAEALKYLYSQISAGEVSFNKVSATVIPNSNYIIRGNEYKAEVFLAASDTTSQPEIFVTNSSNPYKETIVDGVVQYSKRDDLTYEKIEVDQSSGKGIFTMPANSLGEKNWGGIIQLTGPSGTIIKPFKQSYLVAEGAVTVAPTKMNVFYLGVDNPVDVSVAGVQPDLVSISVTNARHEKSRGSYIIKPMRPGFAYVVVYATIDGKKREMGREEFRVKNVPDPIAKINGKKGGRINKSELSAAIGVIAEMEDFDFDLKIMITEFTVSSVVQGFVKEYTSTSNRFTSEQKSLIRSLNRGQTVYIQEIKAVGPDGSTRHLSTINFKLN